VQEELTLTRRRNPKVEAYQVKNGWRISQEYRYQTDLNSPCHQSIHRKTKWDKGLTQRTFQGNITQPLVQAKWIDQIQLKLQR
jgi:hypothetical protein